ncbi:MerR family transcriptional regulator [Streptomyces hokutonensis]|uniref:MerR family transcriptional regulator n=1 Tax=Streptomyces hokutonensis TaxID=1306990 RepID=UPI0033C6BC2E
MSIDRTWKVGALAEGSGLTVRTLHHWDRIGLLSPSRRTAAGHREYTEQDVIRLYEVLALRRLGLGLGLETIATCLDVGVDPVRLVSEQLSGVEASIASLGALRQQLAYVHGELVSARAPDVSALIGALRTMGGTGPESGQALRTAGVEPTAPQVRKLVARMDELSSLFTGGDSGISAAVRSAWQHEPAAMSGDPKAPADVWHDLTAYLDRVRAHARSTA